jgi:hypothetical protein
MEMMAILEYWKVYSHGVPLLAYGWSQQAKCHHSCYDDLLLGEMTSCSTL